MYEPAGSGHGAYGDLRSELQILVLFYDQGGTHLFARTTYHTQEVDDEGNRCDGPSRGDGRDEAGRAARAAGSDKRRCRSDSRVGIRPHSVRPIPSASDFFNSLLGARAVLFS